MEKTIFIHYILNTIFMPSLISFIVIIKNICEDYIVLILLSVIFNILFSITNLYVLSKINYFKKIEFIVSIIIVFTTIIFIVIFNTYLFYNDIDKNKCANIQFIFKLLGCEAILFSITMLSLVYLIIINKRKHNNIIKDIIIDIESNYYYLNPIFENNN